MEPEHMLTPDEIWAAEDIRETTISVPEWGGTVRVRALSLEQMSVLATRATRRGPNGQDVIDRETSVALTVVYGMIEPKLTEADVAKLRIKSASAVTRIVQAINGLGVTEEAVDGAMKSDASELNGALSIFPGARTEDDAE